MLMVFIAALGLAMLGHILAADTNEYRPPDPAIVAKAEFIAASLKAAPSKKKRSVLVYGISFGPHRTTIRTAQEVFKLLGQKTNAYEAVVSEDLANFEYFAHQFYRLGEIEFIEVDA